MDDLPDEITRLAARLKALERRVEALEHPSGAPIAIAVQESNPLHAAQAGDIVPSALAGGAFPVLGKAMLGIAGAYLLRAVAESTPLPKLGVAAIAIVYAVFWLVWAARGPAEAWFASATYACTSALILAPMLWELTLRFNVLPAAATASVLGAFACAAFALAWKRNLAPVVLVANATAAPLALALSIATHELLPFIAALLAMVALSEYAVGRDRGRGVRLLAAAAADVGIWALIFIYSSPQSARADYPLLGPAALLAPGFALFLVYGVSVASRTALARKKITVFETIQTTIAFLLSASGLLYFAPRDGAPVLGVFCLGLSAASYTAVFAVFDRAPERRNYNVFAVWSAALFLAGSVLCLPPFCRTAGLGAAAVAAAFLGVRLRRPALEFHSLVYLLAASYTSGLLAYAIRALAGTLPGAPSASVCLGSACAILCYAAGKPAREARWIAQVLPYASATVAVGGAAAIAVEGLMSLIALNVNPGPHHLAFIRTLILCAAALVLAFSGAHWPRMELSRMGYATLGLVAVKLVFEDLRQGHLEFAAASIFLFAVTLIAVPRLARMGEKAHEAS